MVTSPVRVPFRVGVKVTAILQLFPAASVAPQGFKLVTKAKSPLIVMPEMFSVAFPELRSLTFLAGLVVPTSLFGNVRDVGVRVTTGPPPAVIVSCIVVVCVTVPDVPIMVTVDVPLVAVPLTVRVRVLVVVVGFGENPADTPFGSPEALKLTLPLKPFTGTTVMRLVPLLPCARLTVLGFAVRLKSGPATIVTGIPFDSMPLATAYKV